MRCCTDRPNTWMHPTGAHRAEDTPCTAGAVHTWLYGHHCTATLVQGPSTPSGHNLSDRTTVFELVQRLAEDNLGRT